MSADHLETPEQDSWFARNIVPIIAIGINLLVIGGAWASLRADVAQNREKIKGLEDQRADETRWRVTQDEKRLDAHDGLIMKIGDKLDSMTSTLQRIDQRTSNQK